VWLAGIRLMVSWLTLFAVLAPASAVVDPTRESIMFNNVAVDLNQWQRVDFRSTRPPARAVSQIKIAIQTKGPKMSGLIRIPGAPASNFDTGTGGTVVDLINAGDRETGYPDVVALEIAFTEAAKGQSFSIEIVNYENGMR
jgi:hypothetical protein